MTNSPQLETKRKAHPFKVARLLAVMSLVTLGACGPDGPVPQARIAAPSRPVALVDDAEQADPAVREGHLAPLDDEKVTIALLLPFTGLAFETADALMNAATLALFDAYDPGLEIKIYDTLGTPLGARGAAETALEEGADVMLGPLFGPNAMAAGPVAEQAGIPLFAFSNDPAAAAPGRYILGFQLADEVSRVVNYAADQGHGRFAALSPLGLYGDRVQDAFGEAVYGAQGTLAALARYDGEADSYDEPVKMLADYDRRRRAYRAEVRALELLNDDIADEIIEGMANQEVIGDPDFEAVLVAEGGARLRALAPLLPFYEIDPEAVQLLGTGLWNDPALVREPPLQGAWFAAPEPEQANTFLARFEEAFGNAAPRIATLAYDAVALVATLKREAERDDRPMFSRDQITRIEGFTGLDGPVRFRADGLSERMLAVLEVRRRGFRIVDPAPQGFPSFGYTVMAPQSAQEGR